MKQILTSLLMAIAMIFMGTTTAKADVANEETGQYVLKCGNVSMTIDAAKGGKILSYKYGDQEIISQLKWPESFGSTCFKRLRRASLLFLRHFLGIR